MKMTTKLVSTFLLSGLAFSANAALITSSSDSALTGATLETFNSIASGDYTSLSVTGATIVGNGSSMKILNDSNATSFGKSGNALQNYSGTPGTFDIIFDDVASAFGIWGGAYNNTWNFSAYDSSNSLIESVDVSTSCCSPLFFGLANAGMKKVTLSGYGDWVVFDDLMIKQSVSAVPVPAAAFMFAPALLGFMGLRRKAKNTVA